MLCKQINQRLLVLPGRENIGIFPKPNVVRPLTTRLWNKEKNYVVTSDSVLLRLTHSSQQYPQGKCIMGQSLAANVLYFRLLIIHA